MGESVVRRDLPENGSGAGGMAEAFRKSNRPRSFTPGPTVVHGTRVGNPESGGCGRSRGDRDGNESDDGRGRHCIPKFDPIRHHCICSGHNTASNYEYRTIRGLPSGSHHFYRKR